MWLAPTPAPPASPQASAQSAPACTMSITTPATHA